MEGTNNKIVVILGPTSSGKSDIAIKLAKKFNGEILSADSRQIYRGMDIGTGKVSKAEQKFIKHWMLDISSPLTIFSAAQFKKRVDKIIPDILKRGKLPILCGGTGFWIKAIVDNVSYPEVKPDWKLRNKLRNKSTSKLFEMLKKLDAQRAKNIDGKNKVRLIRAIEIYKTLGKVPIITCHCDPALAGEAISEFNVSKQRLLRSLRFLAMTEKYSFLQIGLRLPKEKLNANIRKRLKKRFEQGMIEEVKRLHRAGLSFLKIQSFGLGYYWIPLYLQGKITKAELFEKIYQAEKNYAKRQMTWFRKDKKIRWISRYKDIEKEVESFLTS